MSGKSAALVMLAFGLFGCASSAAGGDTCAAAADHFRDCTSAEPPSDFSAACATDSNVGDQLLDASCEDVAASGEMSTRADGIADWTSIGMQGSRCLGNWTCRGELVCMPVYGASVSHECQPVAAAAQNDAYGCDDDSDCGTGLTCQSLPSRSYIDSEGGINQVWRDYCGDPSDEA